MRRPKYGWMDLIMRVGAGVLIALAIADGIFGMYPWSAAFGGIALALIACSDVHQLRQDFQNKEVRNETRRAQDVQ